MRHHKGCLCVHTTDTQVLCQHTSPVAFNTQAQQRPKSVNTPATGLPLPLVLRKVMALKSSAAGGDAWAAWMAEGSCRRDTRGQAGSVGRCVRCLSRAHEHACLPFAWDRTILQVWVWTGHGPCHGLHFMDVCNVCIVQTWPSRSQCWTAFHGGYCVDTHPHTPTLVHRPLCPACAAS
jgi:hypothetical protein